MESVFLQKKQLLKIAKIHHQNKIIVSHRMIYNIIIPLVILPSLKNLTTYLHQNIYMEEQKTIFPIQKNPSTSHPPIMQVHLLISLTTYLSYHNQQFIIQELMLENNLHIHIEN
jgi:hypothetical protein